VRARWVYWIVFAIGVLGSTHPSKAEDGRFPLALGLGLGMSTGLRPGLKWTAGWALQASAMAPVGRSWMVGTALNLRIDYLESTRFYGDRYGIAEVSSVVAYRIRAARVAGYGRGGIGMARVDYRRGARGFVTDATRSGLEWALAAQCGAGLEVPLGGGIEAFLDVGVDSIRGSWPYTSGAMLVGLVARR